MSETPKQPEWYIIHTYSGYENKVRDTLLQTIKNNEAMARLIKDAVVPVEDVVERKKDKNGVSHPVTRQRKIYPGYVLVNMIHTPESWFVVRNTRGCTGFVSADSQNPVPLSPEEVDRMLHPPTVDLTAVFAIGDTVVITKGSMANQQGVVTDVDNMRGKATITVQIFGRDTSVEVDYDDLKVVGD